MRKNTLFLLLTLLLCTGCKKFLDYRSSNADVVPSALKDYQAILDDAATMNGNSSGAYPGLGLVGADNYYVTYPAWQAQFVVDQNAYLWNADVFQNNAVSDWTKAYKIIFNANVVLEGLEKIDSSADLAGYNIAKGGALYFRSQAFYALAQLFCKPFSADAATDPGIPLRTTADVNTPTVRSTVEQTYNRISADLKTAEAILPVASSPVQLRPVKGAAQALLARVYLNMEDYQNAGIYADKALSLHNTLLDFNKLDTLSNNPFPAWPNNKEIIHLALMGTYGIVDGANYIIDSLLLQSYSKNDLRKQLFYRLNNGSYLFKGRFANTFYRFAGIGVNEMYFIRAESRARAGNTVGALEDLNTLLSTRWKTGLFTPFTAAGKDEALLLILTERRKEFPFTGSLRWEDLRRLNKDPRFATTLKRLLNGQTYSLPPNSNRYTYPLPAQEINIYNLQQNPR